MFSTKILAGLLLVGEGGHLREILFYPLKEKRELWRKEGGNLNIAGLLNLHNSIST